jgi:hypothetical protein
MFFLNINFLFNMQYQLLKIINNNNPLVIANSDQYIEWNSGKSMYKFVDKIQMEEF